MSVYVIIVVQRARLETWKKNAKMLTYFFFLRKYNFK